MDQDLDAYTHCLSGTERSRGPDDCVRAFDRVKSNQYEYEHLLHVLSTECGR